MRRHVGLTHCHLKNMAMFCRLYFQTHFVFILKSVFLNQFQNNQYALVQIMARHQTSLRLNMPTMPWSEEGFSYTISLHQRNIWQWLQQLETYWNATWLPPAVTHCDPLPCINQLNIYTVQVRGAILPYSIYEMWFMYLAQWRYFFNKNASDSRI